MCHLTRFIALREVLILSNMSHLHGNDCVEFLYIKFAFICFFPYDLYCLNAP